MAVTDVHGSTLADGTEQTLADTSAAGTYVFSFDANPMVAGDVVELRLYEMVLTSGTRRVAYYARYDGAQPADDQIKISVPISTALTDSGAVRATMKQTKGTNHTYAWNVKKFA